MLQRLKGSPILQATKGQMEDWERSRGGEAERTQNEEAPRSSFLSLIRALGLWAASINMI